MTRKQFEQLRAGDTIVFNATVGTVVEYDGVLYVGFDGSSGDSWLLKHFAPAAVELFDKNKEYGEVGALLLGIGVIALIRGVDNVIPRLSHAIRPQELRALRGMLERIIDK